MSEAQLRAEIREHLNCADNLLYAYHKDYRVSGIEIENKGNQSWVEHCELIMGSIAQFLEWIAVEAAKNHITGK